MIVTGCTKERTGSSRPQHQRQTLRIGLVPEQSIFKQVHRYEPLADYLSRKLNVNVSLSVIPSYDKALSSFTAKGLDAAFFESMTYILAHARLGGEPIARPVNLDGTPTYYGVMFVRKDCNIRSVREMRGKRLALVDRSTMAGYLLPLAYCKKAGVDYTTYLKEPYFSGTHEDVIHDVLDRKADIGAAKSTVLTRLSTDDARIKNDLLILARTPLVPESCLSGRRDLSATLKDRLKSVLLNMDEDREGIRVLREFKARKFMETSDSDFNPAYLFARELDIDLKAGFDATVR
ncbi:MAG: phosphate/phosphite/phosphonate ABC transporter substrate-binding protein [Nitrospirae bacterium]|nr:phosphate/phosphite/phosphonate ABC transporter substrate-binding protein [Nitrospirota bacterium]NTW66661.1 phosphate/phosphite/phosphonate ABC transporter substrate-binding protein [Nitrospirota bacterium]